VPMVGMFCIYLPKDMGRMRLEFLMTDVHMGCMLGFLWDHGHERMSIA
jgi:hypothetical protein